MAFLAWVAHSLTGILGRRERAGCEPGVLVETEGCWDVR